MLNVVKTKRHLVQNIGSPYMMALLSYTVFLLAWMFPGPVYTAFLHEPDLLCFDPLTFAYFTACLIAFLLGVYSADYFRGKPQPAAEVSIAVRDPLFYLLMPLTTATIFCGLFVKEASAHINFVALLQSQQAQVIKAAQVSGQAYTGKLLYSIPLLTGTVWWALYRSGEVRLEGIDRWVFRAVFTCAIVVGIVAFCSGADRGNQLIFIVGAIVVSLYRRFLGKGMSFGRLLITGAMSAGVVLTVFLALAYMRGISTVNSLTASFMGYSIASYNRQAALLGGQMTYTYHGTGVYLAPYLLDRAKLNSILPIAQFMGWPTFIDVWHSEFRSVAAAGLNPTYIWSGEFGYLYSDLGWGALVYLFLVGIMVGYAWSRFKAGGSIALMVYPFTTSWILLWVSSMSLFDHPLVELLEVGIVLMLWDNLWIRRTIDLPVPKEQRFTLRERPSDPAPRRTPVTDGAPAR